MCPYDQRLYDVLIELFHGAAEGGLGDSSGADGGGAGAAGAGAGGGEEPAGADVRPQSRSRAMRPRLILHAPLSLLLGIGSGVAELEGVGPVAAEVARRLACDARVTLSLEGPDGSILDQGRVRRDPTIAQRIEIARRDKGCRVPGCLYCEFTDVHHMRHWVHGGLTNLDNLITLCGRHHNAVHELGWSLRGDANGEVTFVTPTGQTMISVPSPTWRSQRASRRRRVAGVGSDPRSRRVALVVVVVRGGGRSRARVLRR